jgi:hypothetical protein
MCLYVLLHSFKTQMRSALRVRRALPAACCSAYHTPPSDVPICSVALLQNADEKRSARAKSLASYLLESILNLGPTFIKVGQLCSTRSDLFPAEVSACICSSPLFLDSSCSLPFHLLHAYTGLFDRNVAVKVVHCMAYGLSRLSSNAARIVLYLL